jgi:hypothetical protein
LLKFKEIAEGKKNTKIGLILLYVRGVVQSREPTKKSAHIFIVGFHLKNLLLKWIFET